MRVALLISSQAKIYKAINMKINNHLDKSVTFLSVPPFQNILYPKTLNNTMKSALLKSSPKADPNSKNSKNNPTSNLSTPYQLLKSQTLQNKAQTKPKSFPSISNKPKIASQPTLYQAPRAQLTQSVPK
jgi:hypothetical protein